MKLKLVALTLIAFACWLVPFKTLAEETRKPKTETKVEIKEVVKESSNETPILTNNENAPIPSVPTKRVGVSDRRDSTPNQGYSGRSYTKEEVIQLIRDYSAQYGISPDLPLRIAKCESGYNQFSRNSHSTASGVFQFLASTWANQPAGKRGVSVFDADANVQAAVWLLAHGKTSMWVCK